MFLNHQCMVIVHTKKKWVLQDGIHRTLTVHCLIEIGAPTLSGTLYDSTGS